ncbi:MAG TPA: recombinase family protein [Candidatus Saccharimonadales bacterium]|nr:recombinase family protein [Candidatus Saccharimonadales bacterium]
MDEEQELDLRTLRYVMYLRKSTEGTERQVRSIPDQERDCKELAKRLGLNVVDTIREEKSAKLPNKRPDFKNMLKRIRAKEFDAVIAWHPDRLSRNSIESGKILHMLDTDVIKDIRFVSHQFSNDANGKMLLGMLFVFSKHYSDDLSSKVTRGVRGNLRDYKSGGTPKHGYIRDSEGIYRKDGDNFVILQKAWHMRAKGVNQQEICDFMNSQGYQKFVAKRGGHVTWKMTDSVLSNIFKETFYFGELVQAGQVIDLVKAPVPFEPMIDRDLYFTVQELSRTRRRTSKLSRKPFLPLRYMVFCDVCQFHKPMQVGRTTGRDKISRLNYACLNKECPRERGFKSVRGKLVFSEIDKVIKDKLSSLPDSAYDEYLKEVKSYSDSAKTKLRSELARAKATKAGYEKRIAELSPSLAIVKVERARETINQQIAEASQFIQEQELLIEQSEKSLERSTLPAIDKDVFKATLKEMAEKLKAADVVQKDIIVSNLFLKLHFDQQKMTHYSLKEPFASLVALTSFQHGGASWI